MKKLLCPVCNTEIKQHDINGLFYKCSKCDFIDDSTLEIMFKYGGFKKI